MPRETFEKVYRAIVEKIITNGKHGPYAVASHDKLGNITFSLNEKCWQEDDWPEPGTFVMLFRLRKKRAGWRASIGRFLVPSDD